MVNVRVHHRHHVNRRGFTLMEALMASAILASAVVAVTWAITAGQQHAFEARRQIAAALLAEQHMGELVAGGYDNVTSGFDAIENVWTQVVSPEPPEDFPPVGVRVRGKQVTVQVYSSDGSMVLAEVTQFIPEPGP